jgi:hypothetical protein
LCAFWRVLRQPPLETANAADADAIVIDGLKEPTGWLGLHGKDAVSVEAGRVSVQTTADFLCSQGFAQEAVSVQGFRCRWVLHRNPAETSCSGAAGRVLVQVSSVASGTR